ncbi:MAG: redox-regulated ATPase YchF [Candidatus Micrarchaeia archaeon]
MVTIGFVGAPNKGKSTLFSALTLADVAIADYPFTTIDPNKGIAYVSRECVDKELHTKCKPRNSLCIEGLRKIPVNIIDVAGLVPGASAGKGMGNQFLNDLSAADAFVIVVDASGKTDLNGNPCDWTDPSLDVEMILGELTDWISGIIMKHIKHISKIPDGLDAISSILSSFKISKEDIKEAINKASLSSSYIAWSEQDAKKFVNELFAISRKFIIAANKSDIQGAAKGIESLKSKYKNVISCSAAIELALRKASKAGLIDYVPGAESFSIKGNPSDDQRHALEYMLSFIKANHGTHVQDIINKAVFEILDYIVVYPVEDENKYTDHDGNVLPDAFLVKRGSTALELAEIIHTDIAKNMLYAVDARTKMKLAKSYILKDNDVIKIVSAAH